MSKYIEAEKLIKAILNMRKKYATQEVAEDHKVLRAVLGGQCLVLTKLIDVVESLQQEQPEVDFKIEERKYVQDAVDNVFPEDGDFMSEVDFRKILKDTARHFYELGLNARK